MTQLTIDEMEHKTEKAINLAGAFANEKWYSEAESAVNLLIKKGEDFDSDEIWRLLSHFDVKTKEPRALGAIMRKYAKDNKIINVGYRKSTRPECHRRPIAIWRPVRQKSQKMYGDAY